MYHLFPAGSWLLYSLNILSFDDKEQKLTYSSWSTKWIYWKDTGQVKDIYHQVTREVSTWNLFSLCRHHVFSDLCSYCTSALFCSFLHIGILCVSHGFSDFVWSWYKFWLWPYLTFHFKETPPFNSISQHPIDNFLRENLTDPVWICSIYSPLSYGSGEGYKGLSFPGMWTGPPRKVCGCWEIVGLST